MTHIGSDAYKLKVPPLSETTINFIKKGQNCNMCREGNSCREGKKEGNKVDGTSYFGWHRETSELVVNEDSGCSKNGQNIQAKTSKQVSRIL